MTFLRGFRICVRYNNNTNNTEWFTLQNAIIYFSRSDLNIEISVSPYPLPQEEQRYRNTRLETIFKILTLVQRNYNNFFKRPRGFIFPFRHCEQVI